jgi:hypothetical protein
MELENIMEEKFCDFTGMRSKDGERFEKIGTVMAKARQASIQEYTYTDIGPKYKFIILKILKKASNIKTDAASSASIKLLFLAFAKPSFQLK